MATLWLAGPASAGEQGRPDACFAALRATSMQRLLDVDQLQALKRACDEGATLTQPELDAIARASATAAKAREEARTKRWSTMVVSGGISMGAWQAGFITVATRYLAVKHPELVPGIWAGASAGSVNAFLGGMLGCEKPGHYLLQEAPMWQVWVEGLGLEDLLATHGQADHLFRDAHMGALLARVGETMEGRAYREGCRFAIGMTVTNLSGRRIAVDRVGLTRVTEKIVLQVEPSRGRIGIRLPFVDQMQPAPPAGVAHLSVGADEAALQSVPGQACPTPGGEVSLADTMTLVRASGAFPLAFPPVETTLWTRTDSDGTACKERWKRHRVQLVDGGLLNNNPLDLAQRMVSAWRTSEGKRLAPFTNHVYLDQDIVSWTWRRPCTGAGKRGPLMEAYGQHAGTLLSAAGGSAVLSAIEATPSLSGTLRVPIRDRVAASEFRFSMMGFFDRRFREHDFYLGLLAGASWAAERSGAPSPSIDDVLAAIELDRKARTRVAWMRDPCGVMKRPPAGVTEEDRQLLKLGCALQGMTATAEAGKLRQDDAQTFLNALEAQGYAFGAGPMQGERVRGGMRALSPVRRALGRATGGILDAQRFLGQVLIQPTDAFVDDWLTYRLPGWTLTAVHSAQRGLAFGIERSILGLGTRDEEGHLTSRHDLRWGLAVTGGGVSRLEEALRGSRYGVWRWWWRLGGRAEVLVAHTFDGASGALFRLLWGAGYGVGKVRGVEDYTQRLDLRLGFTVLDLLWIGTDLPLLSSIGGDWLGPGDSVHDWSLSVGVRWRL